MRHFPLFILLAAGAVLAGCGGPARPGTELVDALMPTGLGKPQVEPAETVFTNGTCALTVVFTTERWALKPQFEHQSSEMSVKEFQEAMRLPEAERLKRMDHIVGHTQVWVVPLEPGVKAGADLKAALPPNPLPHEDYQEPAFLGNGHGYAWYMYAPIYRWVYVQERLRLSDGDDPLAAAARGMTVIDKKMRTRDSCVYILARAGPRALPYVEKAVAERQPWRGQIVGAFHICTDPQVSAWLVELAGSTDSDVAKAAKYALIATPRREAAALYPKWLEEALGHKDPYDSYNRCELVKACKDFQAPGLDAVLRQAVQSPCGLRDYLESFYALREIAGPPIPKELVEAKREIDRQRENAERHTFERDPQGDWISRHVGEPYDQKKVDAAVTAILASPDRDAAAVLGLELAMYNDKVSNDLILNMRRAGLAILRGLPDGKGRRLVSHLLEEFVRDFNLDELKAVAAELEKP
jgi:hypothetical protein